MCKLKDFKEEWKAMQGQRFDRRFWNVLLWEILFVALMILGFVVWAKAMGSLEPLIQQASAPFMTEGPDLAKIAMMGPAQQAAEELKVKTLWYSLLGLLFLFAVWPLTKSLTYLSARKKKWEWRFSLKFLGMQLIHFAVFGIIILFLQYLSYKFFFPYLATSTLHQVLLVVLGVVVAQFLVFWTMMLFSMFAKKEKIWKSIKEWARLCFRKIGHFIAAILMVFVLFIVLNVLMAILRMIPNAGISVFLTTGMMLVFTAWVKIYYNDVMDRKYVLLESQKERLKTVKKKLIKKSSKKKKAVKKRDGKR